MNENPFDRLAPFIREFIYTHGWTELRAVQVAACQVIFDTDAHLLLATGTASGKTEAAFLPVLTLLHEQPSNTIGVLYIGPLRALINDQFMRLNDLLRESDIPVWHWHGDVDAGHKQKMLQKPRGVLQITPESLESLLINRGTYLGAMFTDLRFVIIDEVHAFMGTDRGSQVLCQLQRLARFMRTAPRRIGLSATLGDYSLAENWLASGSDRPVMTPHADAGAQRIRISAEHFYVPEELDRPASTRRGGDGKAASATPGSSAFLAREAYIYESSRGRKCLIFANNRATTEETVVSLRKIAQSKRTPDVYHVHHGSISAPLREAAEEAMRDPDLPTVIAATTSLELGIDIGRLERIIQLQAPFTVSSFVQRLGRSGRRGNPAEMWFVCSEGEPSADTGLPEQIPWDLLQTIAIVQLYAEERWIEPVRQLEYPLSLLYHQTVSTLLASGELSPAGLAQRVLTLPPFRRVSEDDFRELLRHLLSIDHIEQTEGRGLIVGLAGERIARNFRFYAVFPSTEEYAVWEDANEIGTIVSAPPPGERFGLAGRAWEVMDVDLERRVVYVKRVEGRVPACWGGRGGDIHERVLKRMRQALCETAEYPYLQPGALKRLQQARAFAQRLGLDRTPLIKTDSTLYVFPWLGTIGCRTLSRLMTAAFGPQHVVSRAPYWLELRGYHGGDAQFSRDLGLLLDRGITAEALLVADEAPAIQKFDEFIPPHLLRKAFAADYLDMDPVSRAIGEWLA